MKGVVLALRILVAALLVAFLLFAPPYLEQALGRNFYKEWLSGEREDWSGVLTLWHVVEFKTAQGSVTSYLESIAGQYERAHPGVYIEVLGLSPEAVQERLSRGERPHMWSFPSGACGTEELAPLNLVMPAFRGNLAPMRAEGGSFAVPYLYSGYFLLGNTVLIQELGLSWPSDAATLSDTLQQAMDARSTGRYGAVCAPPIQAARLGLTGDMALDGDFKAGQVPFLIGDARAFGDLNRKMANGGFTFDVLPLSGFTEEVQYAGIDKEAQGGYAEHAAGLLSLLLSDKSQMKATALGALPAVQTAEEPQYADGQLQAFYKAYSVPVCPDPVLWREGREALAQEALSALGGSEEARRVFGEHIKAVTPG